MATPRVKKSLRSISARAGAGCGCGVWSPRTCQRTPHKRALVCRWLAFDSSRALVHPNISNHIRILTPLMVLYTTLAHTSGTVMRGASRLPGPALVFAPSFMLLSSNRDARSPLEFVVYHFIFHVSYTPVSHTTAPLVACKSVCFSFSPSAIATMPCFG